MLTQYKQQSFNFLLDKLKPWSLTKDKYLFSGIFQDVDKKIFFFSSGPQHFLYHGPVECQTVFLGTSW